MIGDILKQCLAGLVAAALLLVAETAIAQKDDSEFNAFVEVTIDFDPAMAVGILMDAAGTREIPAAVELLGEGHALVTIPRISKNDSNAYLSAMVISEDGFFAFGNVSRADSLERRTNPATYRPCPDKEASPALASHLALLQSIVEKRTERRRNHEDVLKRELSGELLEKLRRYELTFNGPGSQELGPELTPVDLIYRLERIAQTWDILQQARER